jgi:hypothetical protein
MLGRKFVARIVTFLARLVAATKWQPRTAVASVVSWVVVFRAPTLVRPRRSAALQIAIRMGRVQPGSAVKLCFDTAAIVIALDRLGEGK